MNKNRENFIKYSNDLYFHHLLVENERIRTLICQELVSDRKIISIKLKKAIEEYIKYYNEKRINVKRKGLSPLFYLSFQKSTGSYSCNCARNPAF